MRPFLLVLLWSASAGAAGIGNWAELLTSAEMRGLNTPIPATDREVRELPALQHGSLRIEPVRIVVEKPRFTGISVTEETFGPLASNEDARAKLSLKLAEIKSQYVSRGIPVRLTLKAGDYFFRSEGTAIHLKDFKDFELRGENGTALFFEDPTAEGIRIQGCERVRVVNFSLSYRYSPSYGQLAYMGKALGGNRIEVPALDSAHSARIGAVFSYNPGTGLYFKDGAVASHVPLESGTDASAVAGMPHVFQHKGFGQLTKNERLIIFHTRVGYSNPVRAFGFDNRDITLESLTVHSYPQMGITAAGFRGLHLKNNRVVPRTGSKISGRADAFHVNGMVGDVIIEGNEAQGQGDDGLNIRGTDLSILKPFDPQSVRIQIKNSWDNFARVGDLLALQTNGNEPLALVRVAARTGDVLDLDWGTCDSFCRNRLATKMAQAPAAHASTQAAIAFNLSLPTSRVLVERNRFVGSAARGVLVQAPNVVVRNNRFENLASAAILATAENHIFTDGPGPVNVVIADNRITKANMRKDTGQWQRNGAIALACPRAEAASAAGAPAGIFPAIYGVLVSGNRIEARGYAGILATHARQLAVVSNTIAPTALSWRSGDPAELRSALSSINVE